jgi:GAF domain-containing protein
LTQVYLEAPLGVTVTSEALVCSTLIELADNRLDDFDAVELLNLLATRCVIVLGVSTAGVMLVAPEGDLHCVASSTEAMRAMELFELQTSEGPCVDSFRLHQRIIAETPETLKLRWPRFGNEAVHAGYKSAYAFPMRLRDEHIGSLNIFRHEDGLMSSEDLLAAQAFADMASISILHQRLTLEAKALNDQLTTALTSRVVLEQAKGVLVGKRGVKIEDAFTWMRHHARNNNVKLAVVAQEIVNGTLN